MLEWLQNWYREQCNGDWEHVYGIAIGNVDNPGWSLSIDLVNTHLEQSNIPSTLWETDDENWLSYSIKEKRFDGACDPTRLIKLINVFKVIYEAKDLKEIKSEIDLVLSK